MIAIMQGAKTKFRINWRKYGKGNSPFAAQPDGTKICTKCGEKKPVAQFQKNRSKSDGLYSWCSACANAKTISWIKSNREQHRKIMLAYTGRQKDKIFAHYGNKCACCGETRREFFTIDHKNNDGNKHRAIAMGSKGGRVSPRGGGRTFYTWIIKNKFPDFLQILCWNCNCAKSCFGYCPHERAQGRMLITKIDPFDHVIEMESVAS